MKPVTAFWELEAQEVAQIFDQAYQLVLPYWDQISDMLAVEFKVFAEWYDQSDLHKALRRLNCRLWDICEKSPAFRLMQFWMLHVRKHPERYVDP